MLVRCYFSDTLLVVVVRTLDFLPSDPNHPKNPGYVLILNVVLLILVLRTAGRCLNEVLLVFLCLTSREVCVTLLSK